MPSILSLNGMSKLSSVLPLFLIFLLSSAHSQSAEPLDCKKLFSGVLENEPYLKSELSQLETVCQQEANTGMRIYWSCLQVRMKQGEENFERFMLSAQVCNETSLVQN